MSFKQPEYCSVLGVHVTVGDMDSIKKCVLDNIEELRGKYICVSNVHTTVTAYENRNYRRVQNGAAMVFPDGGPLSIVCRLRGYKNASRVTRKRECASSSMAARLKRWTSFAEYWKRNILISRYAECIRRLSEPCHMRRMRRLLT